MKGSFYLKVSGFKAYKMRNTKFFPNFASVMKQHMFARTIFDGCFYIPRQTMATNCKILSRTFSILLNMNNPLLNITFLS